MLATRPGIPHISMKDAAHACIAVRVTVLAGIEHNDVRTRPRVDSVLVPPSIVGGVVYAHLRVSIDAVVHNVNVRAIPVCERVVAAVKVFTQYT